MASKKTKKKTSTSKKKTTASKKTVRRGRGKGGANKSEFIRQQASSMSARDVVEAGKAAGLSFSEGLVYNVRSTSKKSGKPAAAKRGPGRPKGSGAKSSGSNEAQFRQLVVDLGVSRARALVDEIEVGMRRLIAGG